MEDRIFYAIELTPQEYVVLQAFESHEKDKPDKYAETCAGDIKIDGIDEITITEILDRLWGKGVLEYDETNNDYMLANQSESKITFFSLQGEKAFWTGDL